MIGLHYDIMRYHVIIVRPENQHMYFSKIGLTVSRFTGVDGHEKKNSDLVYHKSTSITCYNSCRHYMALAMDHGFFVVHKQGLTRRSPGCPGAMPLGFQVPRGNDTWLARKFTTVFDQLYIYIHIYALLDVMISILCFYFPALTTGGYMDVNCEDV